MRHVDAARMSAFVDELNKTAGWSDTLRRAALSTGATVAGSGPYGRRLALGAGLGAVGGGAVDEDNRLRGALIGAGLGAGVTGGAILSTPEGRKATREGAKNFLTRQKYSLTGRGVRDLEHAKELGIVAKDPTEATLRPGLINRILGRTPKDLHERALAQVKREEDAFAAGHLHAPGILKGMATHPLQTLKSGWQRTGALGKAFTGLGAYEAGKGFIKKPEEGGPGRTESGLRALGSTAGMVLAPPVLAGGMLVSEGLGQTGKWLGRGVDRATGRLKPPTHDTAVRRPGRETIQKRVVSPIQQTLGVT